MTYSSLTPLTRIGALGAVGDATSRADSMKFKWGYATADVAATVETANYFPGTTQAGYAGWTVGDCIDAVMNAGVSQTPVRKGYVITALGATTSTIALATTTAG